MRRLKSIAVLLVISGVILVLGAVVLQLFTPAGESRPEFSEGEESFSGVREIIVVSGALPITIEETDEAQCTVSWKSGLPLIMSCDEMGTLRITEDDSFTLSLFSKSMDSAGIKISVPKRGYGRISLSSSSGDIVCTGVTADSLEISTRSGYLHVLNANEHTKIRNESGTTYLAINRFEGEMTVNGGSGRMIVDICADFDFFVEFATEGGSCTSAGFDKNAENRKGDAALLSGRGGNTLKINTTTGNLEINKYAE